jgi:hypothetical protein
MARIGYGRGACGKLQCRLHRATIGKHRRSELDGADSCVNGASQSRDLRGHNDEGPPLPETLPTGWCRRRGGLHGNLRPSPGGL